MLAATGAGRRMLDETKYTLESLSEIAADLADGHEQFLAYLAEAGLIGNQANIAIS